MSGVEESKGGLVGDEVRKVAGGRVIEGRVGHSDDLGFYCE